MNRKTFLLVVAAAVGIACLAVGLGFPPRPSVEYPARFAADTSAAKRLESALEGIEGAATSGDIARFREALTARFLGELERQVQELGGRRIDAMWLHDAGSFLGDVHEFQFRGGIGSGARAWVVFSVGGGALAGHELRAFEFDATDGQPRLDRKRSRRLQGSDDARSAAAEWLRELGTDWP